LLPVCLTVYIKILNTSENICYYLLNNIVNATNERKKIYNKNNLKV